MPFGALQRVQHILQGQAANLKLHASLLKKALYQPFQAASQMLLLQAQIHNGRAQRHIKRQSGDAVKQGGGPLYILSVDRAYAVAKSFPRRSAVRSRRIDEGKNAPPK